MTRLQKCSILYPFSTSIIKCCNVQLETAGYYLAKTIDHHQLPPQSKSGLCCTSHLCHCDVTISGEYFHYRNAEGRCSSPPVLQGSWVLPWNWDWTMRLPMVLEKTKTIVMMSLIQVCLASKARGFFPLWGQGTWANGNLKGTLGPDHLVTYWWWWMGADLQNGAFSTNNPRQYYLELYEYSVHLRDYLIGSKKWIFLVKDGLPLTFCRYL